MPKHKPSHTIRCEYCKYTWNTTSKHVYVTCPSCLKKTLNKPIKPIPLTPEAELHQKIIKK